MKRSPSLILLAFLSVFFHALIAAAEDNLAALVKKIRPAVVTVVAYDDKGQAFSQGNGFFISRKGDLITNRHVIEHAHSAEVKTSDGKAYAVKGLVAEDREGDIVQLVVDIPEKAVTELKVSGTVPEVGERIAVIGSPLGLEQTVSDGIVSAVRDIPGFGKIFQITAPISPGSSGSPVVNMKGEVIGVATLQLVEGQNLNFGVPGERLLSLQPQKVRTLAKWTAELFEKGVDEIEILFSAGLRLVWANDCAKAIPYFENMVMKGAKHAAAWLAWFHLGYCNSELGRLEDAVEAYKQVLRLKPDVANAHYNLGVAYGKLGRYTEAIEATKQAIRLKPDYAEAHYNLGVAYGILGRYAEAIEASKQAIRHKPTLAEAHYILGVAYGNLGRYAEEIEAYKQAVRLKPDYAKAHYNLGAAYGKLGRYAEAIDAFKQAIRLKPDYARRITTWGRLTSAWDAMLRRAMPTSRRSALSRMMPWHTTAWG